MKNENKKKSTVVAVISTIIFTFVLIGITFIVSLGAFRMYAKMFNVGEFMISYSDEKVIEGKVKVLSDSYGLKQDGYEFSVTNNGKKTDEYYIYVKSLNNTDLDGLVVGLNNYVVQRLDSFPMDEDYYLISSEKLDSGYTSIHNIRIWWDSSLLENDDELELEFGIIEK